MHYWLSQTTRNGTRRSSTLQPQAHTVLFFRICLNCGNTLSPLSAFVSSSCEFLSLAPVLSYLVLSICYLGGIPSSVVLCRPTLFFLGRRLCAWRSSSHYLSSAGHFAGSRFEIMRKGRNGGLSVPARTCLVLGSVLRKGRAVENSGGTETG